MCAALAAGHSVLVRGRPGIGKAALLAEARRRLSADRPCLWVRDTDTRAMAGELAEQAHQAVGLQVPEHLVPQRHRAAAYRAGRLRWEWVRGALARAPSREVVALVVESVRDRGAVVFVESIDLPPARAELLLALASVAPLAAASDAGRRRPHLEELLWRFHRVVDLGPLPRAATRALAERWLAERPVAFASPRAREAFLRAVEHESGGVPAAIEGMVGAAAHDALVTLAGVRAYRHEAGARYFDMTPLLLVALVAFVALRYIARGANDVELFVLSGVVTSLLVGLRMLLGRIR